MNDVNINLTIAEKSLNEPIKTRYSTESEYLNKTFMCFRKLAMHVTVISGGYVAFTWRFLPRKA